MEILRKEPYFEIENLTSIGCGERAHSWGAVEEIQYNQSLLQQTKLDFYRHAMHMIAHNKVEGDYWEFGCHKARTFRMAMQEAYKHEFTRSRMQFHAFDSFEGLPQDSNQMDEWKKGNLCTSLKDFLDLIINMPNFGDVKSHKGFYQDLLPMLKMEKEPALICVDCDLHDSAISVFEFIRPHLKQGTIIYVDDWFVGENWQQGVRMAFYNKLSGYTLEPFLNVGWWGKAFIVL